MSRARWGLITAAVVVFLLVGSQILIPAIGARRIESRLTEGGGTADVTLGAVPALRLLFGDGERFQVEANGLDLALDRRGSVFDKLDGFGVVDIAIDDSKAGPFELQSFHLTRESPAPYHLTTVGRTSPADLVDAGLQVAQLPGGGVLDQILGQFFGPQDTPVPVELDMQLTSENGRVQVVSGGGTVAGVPTGSLAELITSAIVIQL